MACPTCGGTNRSLIAPGYYQCRSIIRWSTRTWVPAPGYLPGPGVPMAPIDTWHERACTDQYQEGDAVTAQLPLCACFTYAVGICADCKNPVCGVHSELVGDLRRCFQHSAEFRRTTAQKQERDKAHHMQAASAWVAERFEDAKGWLASRPAGPGGVDELTLKVVDAYWYWHSQGRGDISLVAEQLSITTSEATKIINAAGKDLLEARRPT